VRTFIGKGGYRLAMRPEKHKGMTCHLNADRPIAELVAPEDGMPMIHHCHGRSTRSIRQFQSPILTLAAKQ
jgi:hypothetical protein